MLWIWLLIRVRLNWEKLVSDKHSSLFAAASVTKEKVLYHWPQGSFFGVLIRSITELQADRVSNTIKLFSLSLAVRPRRLGLLFCHHGTQHDGFDGTLSINDFQHYNTAIMLNVVFNLWLCWMTLFWVSLFWIPLCWVSRPRYFRVRLEPTRAINI